MSIMSLLVLDGPLTAVDRTVWQRNTKPHSSLDNADFTNAHNHSKRVRKLFKGMEGEIGTFQVQFECPDAQSEE